MTRRTVVVGFLGTQLDSGQGAGRWEKWRPTVALCQHEDLLIDLMDCVFNSRGRYALQIRIKRRVNPQPV